MSITSEDKKYIEGYINTAVTKKANEVFEVGIEKIDELIITTSQHDKEIKEAKVRLNKIEIRLDKIEALLDKVEKRLDAIEARLDVIETLLTKIAAKILA